MDSENPGSAKASTPELGGDPFAYIEERFRPQLAYFERKAAFNQGRFLLMRRMMLIASWLTPIAIFVQFMLPVSVKEQPGNIRDLWSLVPMILSTIAVGSYQWEEQHNYGSQWSKFRLVAENLKHQLVYFENGTGPFRGVPDAEARRVFVEITEKMIEGTDINYFTLMVDPHKSPAELS